ncbi:MAG: hypothetical protein M5U01_36105 [Ardenticatenaceae bacterium]|nr:hypothetical protein [Ardenticatenaceae bacterium]HBY94331.1 hypothetical protein [Chloroflexota bacterium]
MNTRTSSLLAVLVVLPLLAACGGNAIKDARPVAVATPASAVNPFKLPGQPGARQVFALPLSDTGRLEARATWEGTRRLAIIVYRQGVAGYYARQEGADGQATLDWLIPPEAIQESQTHDWRVAVVNLDREPAQGRLTIAFQPSNGGNSASIKP